MILVLSLIIGSFLNVIIYRLPRSESIVWPGSHCTACGHTLRAIDLIPVVSYLLLRGRCRYCREKISLRYSLVEVFTALACLLIYLKGGSSFWTLTGCILVLVLIVSAFIDIDEGIIPDRITYSALGLGLLLSPFSIGIKASLLGGLFFGLFLLLIVLITQGGMGGGDVKLAAVMGVFTGLKGALLVLVLASVLGGIWAFYLILRGQADRKTAIKFGPFLAIAGFLVWNWQTEILDSYWQLIM